MRFHLAAVLLLSPLFAQEQPPATAPAQPPAPKPDTRQETVVPAPGSPAGKICAIPLLKVLKSKAAQLDRMPRVQQSAPLSEKFSSGYIIPPAPSCDDVK